MWDDAKLQERVHPEDIPLIKKTRLRLIKTPDSLTWIFTKDGQYTVKSGYHQLIKPGTEHQIATSTMNALWKHLWHLNIPPEIFYFWWKVLHNALPVAENYARRRIKVMPECAFCGDAKETVLHLLFHCRFAKETWELSPLQIESGQFEGKDSVYDIMQYLLTFKDQTLFKEHVFPSLDGEIMEGKE